MANSIFILTNTLKTGGAEKQSIYLFNALSEQYKVNLIVFYGDQVDSRMLNMVNNYNKHNVIYLDGSHASKALFLYKLFKENRDPICVSYLATTNAINAFIGLLAGVRIRIGGIRNSQYNWFKLALQRVLHNHFLTLSVFNNNVGYEILSSKGFNAEKGVIIHNCIEVPVPIKFNFSPNPIVILSVGRFVEQKDYNTAIKAIGLLNGRCNYKYIIVGHGHLENELRQVALSEGISQNIQFVINPTEVDSFYKQAHIYLSTSTFEGLSNSIMEAVSFGLPIVATNVGDNEHLVKDGITGFLVPPKDVELIADKLLYLVENPHIREELGQNGYNHISGNFSIEEFTNKYINLIENLMNDKKYS